MPRATPQGRVHQLTVPAKIRAFGKEIARQARAVRCENALSKQHSGTLRRVNVLEAAGQEPKSALWCEHCIQVKMGEQIQRARDRAAAAGFRGVRSVRG